MEDYELELLMDIPPLPAPPPNVPEPETGTEKPKEE